MTYEPQSFAGFGAGLNLRDKSDAVDPAQAIDCMNVEFTETGAVKQRPGYDVFTAVPLASQPDTLFPHYESDGTRHLIVGEGAGGSVEALSTTGASIVSNTGPTGYGVPYAYGYQRFGAPGLEYTYVGIGNASLLYYDGAVFTQLGATAVEGASLGLSPGQGGNTSNRLVNARFANATGGPSGAATNPSTVWFSDVGAPTAWSANNYLHLDPGDGESIQAMVNWREFLFVFKETKFYVFTGESTNSAGNPIFNYYTVNTGEGACGPRAVDKDETGVYFASRRGVFRTRGGEPEKVSSLIDPIFFGGESDFFTGGVLAHANASLIAVNAYREYVFVNYSSAGSTNNRTLAYNVDMDTWTLWDVAAADMVGYRATDHEQLFFSYSTGNNEVARGDPSYTDDDGALITSHWRSGWFDYGLPVRKTIRESKLWGYGKVNLAVANDFKLGAGELTLLNLEDPTLDTWGGTTWDGGSWATPRGRVAALRRYSTRGTVFSTSFYNNTLNQEWIVARCDHHLRETAIPSKKTAIAA